MGIAVGKVKSMQVHTTGSDSFLRHSCGECHSCIAPAEVCFYFQSREQISTVWIKLSHNSLNERGGETVRRFAFCSRSTNRSCFAVLCTRFRMPSWLTISFKKRFCACGITAPRWNLTFRCSDICTGSVETSYWILRNTRLSREDLKRTFHLGCNPQGMILPSLSI